MGKIKLLALILLMVGVMAGCSEYVDHPPVNPEQVKKIPGFLNTKPDPATPAQALDELETKVMAIVRQNIALREIVCRDHTDYQFCKEIQ